MYFILILLVLVSISEGTAQINAGSKQIAMSNSDVALSDDVFSVFNNPAGIGQFNWREAGIFYSPSPFGLKELSTGYIAYTEPLSFGSVGAGAMIYGFDLYKEVLLQSSLGYKVNNQLFIGASLNYNHFSIQNYGSKGFFYLNLGGLYYIEKSIRSAIFIENVLNTKFNDNINQVPLKITAGLSLDLIENISLTLAVNKEKDFPVSFNTGLNYDIIEYISVRGGFSDQTRSFSGGLGINYNNFSLDYSVFSHNELGLTHQAGITISFGRETSRRNTINKNLFPSE